MKSIVLAAIASLAIVTSASADTFTVHGVFGGNQYTSSGK